MRPGRWQTCLVDIDRASEFTGDDVDQYSELIALGGAFEFVTVIMPALESTTPVTPYIQRGGGEDEVPVPMYFFHDIDADTDVIQSSVSATGGYALIFRVGGAEFVRLYCGTTQTADRTFYVRGFNRE